MIAVEAAVAAVFVVVAAAGVTGPAWLLVAGFAGHGFKDLWQHRSHYVANTRWWPPFCLVVDWVVAAILVVLHRRRGRLPPLGRRCLGRWPQDQGRGSLLLVQR